MYQRYLQKQTAELEQLQQERQRLLEVQEELARMSRRSEAPKTVATQVQTCLTQIHLRYTVNMEDVLFTSDRTLLYLPMYCISCIQVSAEAQLLTMLS